VTLLKIFIEIEERKFTEDMAVRVSPFPYHVGEKNLKQK
jgi:hypothetical protein